MSGLCRDCKYWGEKSWIEWEAAEAGMRRCDKIDARNNIEDSIPADIERYGDGDGWLKAQKEALLSAKAYTQDASDYVSSLYTAGDFGCVLFAKREVKP